MKVFLLEPYCAGSHAQWVEGYRRASRHEVIPITHEGQFWKWRLTGGFVTIAEEVRRRVSAEGTPDVVLATSMLDVAGLAGLARRALAGVPVALYMHENQITYPAAGRTRVEAQHGLVTWSSLLAADAIAFNSAFHRDALLEALPGFLGGFPDRRQGHLVARMAERAIVLPVGVDLARLAPVPAKAPGTPLILWNHRWDPDKDPGAFLEAVLALAADGVDFRVALTGERPGLVRDTWSEAVARLGDRVVAADHLDEAAYRDVLHRSHIVVSTARQEFFGVAIVEAMYAGAFPLLPDRLVYPERIPADVRHRCLYRGRRRLIDGLRWAVEHPTGAADIAAGLRDRAARYDWSEVAPRYDDWLEGIRSSSTHR